MGYDSVMAHPERADQGAWALLVLGLGIWLASVLWRVIPFIPTSPGDFEHYYRGAAAWRAGESLFSRPELDYPPLLPLLVAPFAGSTLAEARWWWLLVSTAAVVLGAIGIWRAAGGGRRAAIVLSLVLLIDGTTAPNLGLGQANVLVFALLSWSLAWSTTRPRTAGALIGLAGALKIWPLMLLGAWLLPFFASRHTRTSRSTASDLQARAPSSRTRLAVLGWGLGVAAAGTLLPWALLRLGTPAPHWPTSGPYWLGTPASLNFSVPATALRASYNWRDDGTIPPDWRAGVSAGFQLSPSRRWIAVVSSLLCLAVGGGALAWATRQRSAGLSPTDLLPAFVALALVAAPIAWYHYQIFQLPGLALLGTRAIGDKRWGTMAATAVLTLALTRHSVWEAGLGALHLSSSRAAFALGLCAASASCLWFAVLVAALVGVGRGRPPQAPQALR